ncbi:MAG: DUF885 domain-containing protein [Wenzhouxiangellaceae bacterium]
MRNFFKWAFRLLLLLVVVGGLLFANFWYFKPLSINWYYSQVFLKFALDNPETLTSLRLLEPMGITGHNARLGDYSPENNRETFAFLRDQYDTFKRYDREDYSGNDLLSYDIFDHFVSEQLAGEKWMFYNFPVNQMFGVQSSLPNFMTNQHIIDSEHAAEQYLTRLRLFPEKFSEVLEGLRLREDMGILPPRFAVEKTLEQMRDFIAKPAAEHMLYVHFSEQLDELGDDIDEGSRERLLNEAVSVVETSVYPAYEQLIDYMASLQSKATSNDGVWRLPDGDEFYANQVREHTTTDMSAEEIHRMGLAEVDRIGREMDAILRGEGLVEGTIGERVQQIGRRPDQLYPDTDAGREQILADYQRIIDEIDGAMDEYFNLRPEVGVEVVRIPEFSEKTAPGAYYQSPSLDGSRPGRFFANLRDVSAVPRFSMRTLAYHEAIPGHHFQNGITQSLEGLPMFRRLIGFTAYSEGWALYAERLAWEIGFQDDPLDNLGRLQAEMFRAVRLVVDTGMHHKRWTREQAIQYMMEHTGMPEGEVVSEIERYLVNPGQALAYKVGMMKILELREQAKAQLGERFDLKAFHDQVLGKGALPISLLERVIAEWIAAEQAAA